MIVKRMPEIEEKPFTWREFGEIVYKLTIYALAGYGLFKLISTVL